MNHSTHQLFDKHPKQDFQVERLAFFSDAVFAIAITLLVIEIKIPHVTSETTYQELWHEVKDMRFQFLALFLSFGIIGTYWMKHHILFKYIHNYNLSVTRINLFSLLPIIFFPFTTAFVYENFKFIELIVIPLRLFLLNNILANFSLYLLYWTVMVKNKHLSYPMETKDKLFFTSKLYWTGISFTIVFILTFFTKLELALLGMLPIGLINIKDKYYPSRKK